MNANRFLLKDCHLYLKVYRHRLIHSIIQIRVLSLVMSDSYTFSNIRNVHLQSQLLNPRSYWHLLTTGLVKINHVLFRSSVTARHYSYLLESRLKSITVASNYFELLNRLT